MSAKVKLISFISAFVLVLGIMIIGVLSAEQVQVNIGGSVSFNATNVYAKVSGNISGAETGNKTFSTLTYSASETTGDESDWTNLALEFTETPDPIVITITVENLSTQRTLTANLTNSLSASGLNIAVMRDSASYASATNVELGIAGSNTDSTTFTLALSVANPDEDLTDATFGYTLNMYDESVAPAPPTSASSFEFAFNDDGTATITDFVGDETEVVIPSTVNKLTDTTATEGSDYTVTSIGDDAFDYCSSLTTITIPASVTSIGTMAFHYCSALTSIIIPEGVTTIGSNAFNECSSLTSITIPASVTSIDFQVFYSCRSLTTITIPDSVSSIGVSAFQYCSSLTSITIGEGMTNIGTFAFYGCSSLTSITINATMPPTLGSSAIPSNVTNIYVPSASVSVYQTAWSSYSSIISAIV